MTSWIKRKFDRLARWMGYIKPNEENHAHKVLQLFNETPPHPLATDKFTPNNRVYIMDGSEIEFKGFDKFMYEQGKMYKEGPGRQPTIITDPHLGLIFQALRKYNEETIR